MANTSDYPFHTWQEYYAALAESCSTEFYGETYPEYEALCMEKEGMADLEIIQNLLESGAKPQEGFNELLRTFIKYNRYSAEYINSEDFPSILKAFFNKGVHLDINILLDLYVATSPEHFEDEAYSCYARGQLIRALIPFVPDIIDQLDNKVNWNTIEPMDWEESAYWDESNKPKTLDDLRRFIYASMKYSYNTTEDE